MYSVDSTVTPISPSEWQHSKESMCCLKNIAMCDYKESVTTGQTHTDRRMLDKVIPMCHYTSQATQKKKTRSKWWYMWCHIQVFCFTLSSVTSSHEIWCKRKYKFFLYNQICVLDLIGCSYQKNFLNPWKFVKIKIYVNLSDSHLFLHIVASNQFSN